MKRNNLTTQSQSTAAQRPHAAHEQKRRRELIPDEYSPAVHSAVRYRVERPRGSYPSGSMC